VKIRKVRLFSKECQLAKPYELSFVTLTSFKSTFVEIELENHSSGLGEATALPGYGMETSEQIRRILGRVRTELQGATLDQSWQTVNRVYSRFPFAASAIGTALEFASGEFVLPEKLSIPLLYPVSASRNTKQLVENVRLAFERGFRTVKVKIGKDFDTDLESARALLQESFNIRYHIPVLIIAYDSENDEKIRKALAAYKIPSRIAKNMITDLKYITNKIEKEEIPGVLILRKGVLDE